MTLVSFLNLRHRSSPSGFHDLGLVGGRVDASVDETRFLLVCDGDDVR
jgi:hypothetical protein